MVRDPRECQINDDRDVHVAPVRDMFVAMLVHASDGLMLVIAVR